jgi:hypothetical protein
MVTLSFTDDTDPFDVTRLDATHSSRVVLFAVGGGGSPERHLPLLNALADRGCTVVAPTSNASPPPSPRERTFSCALDVCGSRSTWWPIRVSPSSG